MKNSPGPVNSPHKGPVTGKMFPFDDVIMIFAYEIGVYKIDEHYDALVPTEMYDSIENDETHRTFFIPPLSHTVFNGFYKYLCIHAYTNDSINNDSDDGNKCSTTMSRMKYAGKNLFQCSGARTKNECLDSTHRLKKFPSTHVKNRISGHLNINSIRGKFTEASELLTEELLDVLFLSETKLDVSFPSPQFHATGYKCHRADRNQHGGGIMAYVRNDLPHRRRSHLEHAALKPVEAMIIEMIIRNEKWLLMCLYDAKSEFKSQCCDTIEAILETVQSKQFSIVFVVRDLNINVLCQQDSMCLFDVMETHGLTNVISEPTFSNNSTMLDMVLTTNRKRIADTLNIDVGLSDFHDMIYFSSEIHVPRKSKNVISYRSYKTFDLTNFKNDISTVPYHVGELFDDFSDKFWFTDKLICEVVDEHAPRKTRKPVDKPVPFMNSELRKMTHSKSMARNKFFKYGRTQKLWDLSRKIRNLTTIVKTASMRKYLDDKCNTVKQTGRTNKFWDTTKTFVTN